MQITVVSSHRSPHQLEHQNAMAEGLKTLGHDVSLSYSVETVQTKHVACWGWRNGKMLRKRGHEVLVMERGYLADRFTHTSLAWNGLNGHGTFPSYPSDGGERFRSLNVPVLPWRMEGKYALILCQVPGDMSLQGMDMLPWYEAKAKEIAETHGLPVVYRQHPDLDKKGIKQIIKGADRLYGTLPDALADAALTICFNSNSSVDSILAGVPCVVGDRGTMAWNVCGKEVGDLMRVDRDEWLHDLAWKQWEMNEIRSGFALRGLVACAP